MAKILTRDRKLNSLIRRTVIETVREIFNDPDYGLPLSPETIRRLKKSIKSKKAGRVISLKDVLKKYSQ